MAGPQCGGGSIASSAWDGHTLYVAGGRTSINGTACQGSLRAITPNTITFGSSPQNATVPFLWQHCLMNGPVLGSVTVAGATPASEVVAVSQRNTVIVVNAHTGKTLARLSDHKHGSLIYSPPTIANGVIFVGNQDGNLYAYSVNGR